MIRYCNRKIACGECPKFAQCTTKTRLKKRRRSSFADSASHDLVTRAAKILEGGWYSCEKLGTVLYNKTPTDRKGRMSIMVRARRPINRLKQMGMLAMRQNDKGYAEYTLIGGGEVFCAQ